MSRLSPLPRDAASADQQELWDAIVDSRGKALQLIDDTGSLRGPFHAMVARPHLGKPMSRLGGAIRFESSLPDNLLEIAICTAGVHWKSEFEFWAHRRLAVAAGVDEAKLDAMAAGADPGFEGAEAAVHAYAAALVASGRVPADVYEAAIEAVGEDSVIDVTMTVGYYTQISFILNAFEVPLPPGVDPTWP